MTKLGWVIMIVLAIIVATTSAWVVIEGQDHVEHIDIMKAQIDANTKATNEQQAAIDKRIKEVDDELKRVDMQLDFITKAIQDLEKDVKELNDLVRR